MKITDVVVGNSSSGVLETPSLKVPTVNIGNRQNGRIISKNILNSNYEVKQIVNSIKKALKMNKTKLKNIKDPFFKKNTPKNISKKIVSFKCNNQKIFFDLN